jgi:hypothetical protein
MNAALARNMGTNSAQAIGKTDFDFHSPELAQKFYSDEQALYQAKLRPDDRLQRTAAEGRCQSRGLGTVRKRGLSLASATSQPANFLLCPPACRKTVFLT